jgi:hypothetical protein
LEAFVHGHDTENEAFDLTGIEMERVMDLLDNLIHIHDNFDLRSNEI